MVSYFSQKKGFNISCTLSPVETISIKYQILFTADYLHEMSILFSGKNISIYHLMKILPRVLNINLGPAEPGYALTLQTV